MHKLRLPILRTLLIAILGVVIPGNLAAQQLIPAPKQLVRHSQKYVQVRTIDARLHSRADLPEEGYTLSIRGKKARLRARTAQGLVWARATLQQLRRPDGTYPEVSIRDYPAFPLRGFMYDCGRTFRPTEQLKRDIDLLSSYKINVYHLHLTDHPAWRIESRAYPQLNLPENHETGRDEGKFYTYRELHELIAYARERGITIIPEIDMPGHSQYFQKTFGCTMDSEKGQKILEACLNEFFQEITADECPYFHIGSDEVHVKKPEEFMAFCEAIVRKHGRTPVCWNPGLKPSDNCITQIWNAAIGQQRARQDAGNPYIDSYQGYLNNGHPLLNAADYFLHTACGQPQATAHARGGILCLWTDIPLQPSDFFALNGMPGCLLPFAERLWCGGEGIDPADEHLLPTPSSAMHKQLAEFEQRMAYHRDHLLYDYDIRWVANSHIPWTVSLPAARGTRREELRTVKAWGAVIHMNSLCRKHEVPMLPTMEGWMSTEIHVPHDTVITAWISFDTPVRVNRRSPGIGYQGHWESDGRVFVNQKEIFPPRWKEPGKYRYDYDTWYRPEAKIPYTHEQFCWMRPPVRLPLKAGWNRIELYCPRTIPGGEWFVTFLPVHPDANGHVSEARQLQYR